MGKRPAPLTEKDSIILGEIANKTGDPVFDGTLRQALAVQLGQSPFLDILPDERWPRRCGSGTTRATSG